MRCQKCHKVSKPSFDSEVSKVSPPKGDTLTPDTFDTSRGVITQMAILGDCEAMPHGIGRPSLDIFLGSPRGEFFPSRLPIGESFS